jgi:hypothetical protein
MDELDEVTASSHTGPLLQSIGLDFLKPQENALKPQKNVTAPFVVNEERICGRMGV